MLARASRLFGIGVAAKAHRSKLAAAIAQCLTSLQQAGIDDAVYAEVDRKTTFKDDRGTPRDIDVLGHTGVDVGARFKMLRLCVRESNIDAEPVLACDLRVLSSLPPDGCPIRFRIQGFVQGDRSLQLAAARRDGVMGLQAVDPAFIERVDTFSASLRAAFPGVHVDTAMRSAVIVERADDVSLQVAPKGAGALSHIGGRWAPTASAFAWSAAHEGVSYRHTLIVDGLGRPVASIGATPAIATKRMLAPGRAPTDLPANVEAFTEHSWDAAYRGESCLAPSAGGSFVDEQFALLEHERRIVEFGSRPARSHGLGNVYGDGGGGSDNWDVGMWE